MKASQRLVDEVNARHMKDARPKPLSEILRPPTKETEMAAPTATADPRAVSWTPALDGESVKAVRTDLPSIADVRAFEIELTETTLIEMLSSLRAAQLGLDDVTGGL